MNTSLYNTFGQEMQEIFDNTPENHIYRYYFCFIVSSLSMLITEAEVKKLQWLSSKEVKERIIKDGYNELPSAKKKNFLQIVRWVIQEPMLLLLIACGTLYLFLGDTQEAIILL